MTSKQPWYLQLADQIRPAIESGELPCDLILSLNQVAGQTGLAVGTIQKANRKLEQESLIYAVTGRGPFIAPGNTDAPKG